MATIICSDVVLKLTRVVKMVAPVDNFISYGFVRNILNRFFSENHEILVNAELFSTVIPFGVSPINSAFHGVLALVNGI